MFIQLHEYENIRLARGLTAENHIALSQSQERSVGNQPKYKFDSFLDRIFF